MTGTNRQIKSRWEWVLAKCRLLFNAYYYYFWLGSI